MAQSHPNQVSLSWSLCPISKISCYLLGLISTVKAESEEDPQKHRMQLKSCQRFLILTYCWQPLSVTDVCTWATVLVETQASEETSYCTKQWWQIREAISTFLELDKSWSSSQNIETIKIPKDKVAIKWVTSRWKTLQNLVHFLHAQKSKTSKQPPSARSEQLFPFNAFAKKRWLKKWPCAGSTLGRQSVLPQFFIMLSSLPWSVAWF